MNKFNNYFSGYNNECNNNIEYYKNYNEYHNNS